MEPSSLEELIQMRNDMVEIRQKFADALDVTADAISVSKTALRKVVDAMAQHNTQKLQEEIDEICTLLNTHE